MPVLLQFCLAESLAFGLLGFCEKWLSGGRPCLCHLHIKVPVPQEILGVADSSPRDLQPDREASSFASMPEMLTVQGFPAKLEASRSTFDGELCLSGTRSFQYLPLRLVSQVMINQHKCCHSIHYRNRSRYHTRVMPSYG